MYHCKRRGIALCLDWTASVSSEESSVQELWSRQFCSPLRTRVSGGRNCRRGGTRKSPASLRGEPRDRTTSRGPTPRKPFTDFFRRKAQTRPPLTGRSFALWKLFLRLWITFGLLSVWVGTINTMETNLTPKKKIILDFIKTYNLKNNFS